MPRASMLRAASNEVLCRVYSDFIGHYSTQLPNLENPSIGAPRSPFMLETASWIRTLAFTLHKVEICTD